MHKNSPREARIGMWDLLTNVVCSSPQYTFTTWTAFVYPVSWFKATSTICGGTSNGLKEMTNEKYKHFLCPTINI